MREDTIKCFQEYERPIFLIKKGIEDAEKNLTENETVLFAESTNLSITYVGTGKTETFIGIIFLTDKRILLKSQSFKAVVFETISLNEVISVHCIVNKSAKGSIEIQCSTKVYSIEILRKLNMLQQIHQEFETAVNNYKSQHPSQTNTPQPNTPHPDIPEQIEKLAQLRDKGIISEEEFQAKKTDLLSRL